MFHSNSKLFVPTTGLQSKTSYSACQTERPILVALLVELRLGTTQVSNYLLVRQIVVSRRCRLYDLLGFHAINGIKGC